MAHLSEENLEKAQATIGLYPEARSALIPLCHLAQGQDGYLSEAAIADIAALLDITPAEVYGTATFYDMFHVEPVGRYVLSVCTNIACLLAGAYDLLDAVETQLGVSPGQTTDDAMFTLEEAECLAACDVAPCLQVNHRFFGPLDGEHFAQLAADLRAGKLADTVPRHGVLSRVERNVGRLAPGTDASASERSGR